MTRRLLSIVLMASFCVVVVGCGAETAQRSENDNDAAFYGRWMSGLDRELEIRPDGSCTFKEGGERYEGKWGIRLGEHAASLKFETLPDPLLDARIYPDGTIGLSQASNGKLMGNYSKVDDASQPIH